MQGRPGRSLPIRAVLGAPFGARPFQSRTIAPPPRIRAPFSWLSSGESAQRPRDVLDRLRASRRGTAQATNARGRSWRGAPRVGASGSVGGASPHDRGARRISIRCREHRAGSRPSNAERARRVSRPFTTRVAKRDDRTKRATGLLDGRVFSFHVCPRSAFQNPRVTRTASHARRSVRPRVTLSRQNP
jgi:hypothetical protein